MTPDFDAPFEWSSGEEYLRGKEQFELEWRRRYAERLVSRGLTWEQANESANAAEIDPDTTPEDSADDEISYQQEDSK